MFVIAAGKTDAFLAAYYKVKWAIIPNLAMDVLVPPLLSLFDIYMAGKLFVLLVILVTLNK